MCVRGKVLEWFKSYLTERQQRLSLKKRVKQEKSDELSQHNVVPQGSILKPVLLFMIFMNDLFQSVDAKLG
ncbi:hypothetical protein HHI36_005158, partial [Cryptolaemus montrouzieri]